MKFIIICEDDGNANPRSWTFSISEPTRNHANMVEKHIKTQAKTSTIKKLRKASLIFKAFREGTNEVFVGGCHLRDCYYES